MSLRRNELQHSISDHKFELLQVSRQLRKLSSFSNSIGDGYVSPSEIASLGTDLFGDALDFMGFSNDAAAEIAQMQTDEYATAYETLTQEQYYSNPSIASRAELYYDEDGNLDLDTMYQKFYEEALKEYAEECIAPVLKEKEEEIQDKKAELEDLIESEEAELEVVKQQTSQEIRNNTIKLS